MQRRSLLARERLTEAHGDQSSVQNIFKLTSSSLRVGAIDFLYSNEDESATVYVQRDPRGPTAVLRMPTSSQFKLSDKRTSDRADLPVALDKEQAVTLEVHAGLSNMNGIRATILSAQQDVRYLHSRAQSDSEREFSHPPGCCPDMIRSLWQR